MDIPKTGHYDLDALNRAMFDGSPYGDFLDAFSRNHPDAKRLPVESAGRHYEKTSLPARGFRVGIAAVQSLVARSHGRHAS